MAPSTTARYRQSCSPGCASLAERSAGESSWSSPPTRSTASPPTPSSPPPSNACSTAKGRDRQSPPPVLIPGIPTLEALAETVPDEVRAPGRGVLARRAHRHRPRATDPRRGISARPAAPSPCACRATRSPSNCSPRPDRSRSRAPTSRASPPPRPLAEAEAMLGDSVAVYLDGGPAGECYPGAAERPGRRSSTPPALDPPGGQAAHRAPRRHPRRRDRARSWGPTDAHSLLPRSSAGVAAIVTFALSFADLEAQHALPAVPEDPRARRAHPADAAPRRDRDVHRHRRRRSLVASQLPQFEHRVLASRAGSSRSSAPRS